MCPRLCDKLLGFDYPKSICVGDRQFSKRTHPKENQVVPFQGRNTALTRHGKSLKCGPERCDYLQRWREKTQIYSFFFPFKQKRTWSKNYKMRSFVKRALAGWTGFALLPPNLAHEVSLHVNSFNRTTSASLCPALYHTGSQWLALGDTIMNAPFSPFPLSRNAVLCFVQVPVGSTGFDQVSTFNPMQASQALCWPHTYTTSPSTWVFYFFKLVLNLRGKEGVIYWSVISLKWKMLIFFLRLHKCTWRICSYWINLRYS